MDNKRPMKNLVKGISPWQVESNIHALPQEKKAFIEKCAQSISYEKKQIILLPGEFVERLCYIKRGVVKYHNVNKDGEEQTLSYIDDFLGIEALFLHLPFSCYATAWTNPVELCIVEKQYEESIFADPVIRHYIYQCMARRASIFAWQISDLSLHSALERVCRLLCCYAAEEQDQLSLRLSRQELANMAGVHRVTISKILTQLDGEGLLACRANGSIKILEYQKMLAKGFGILL